MDHNLGIFAILTVGFALASFLAYVAQYLKLPFILGYLLAGFVIGPFFSGFIADLDLAEQLAEIGVILMLFGVGLHFKLEDLMGVRNIAIPGATGQTFAATLAATWIVYEAGWSLEAGVIIGLAIGVASTVVLIRVLSDHHLLHTQQGHIAIGWLVVEDIFTVIILILLPSLANFSTGVDLSYIDIFLSFIIVIAKFALLLFLMFKWGHKVIGYILTNIARIRSQELFTLTVMTLVFLIAVGSSVIFGTSMALGAFIAGMVIGKTNVRHQAAANALPLKDVFAIIFFLSVGMLFNPMAIVSNFPLFIGIIFIILIIKPLVAFLITVFLGYSLIVALTVAISLAQIGEFSFILAEEASRLHLLPDEGYDLLVACAILSISLNPLLFQLLESFESTIRKSRFFKRFNTASSKVIKEHKEGHPKAVVIGYGPIGKEVSHILQDFGFNPVIIEQNIDTVAKLEEHHSIIFGDAAESNILKDAHLEDASYLFITIPNTSKVLSIIHAAHQVNPDITIIARTSYIGEENLMEEAKVNYVCTEHEALKEFISLTRSLLENK